ncbi:MAG: hypothetical protein JSW39_02090 [Desulfobacterales bacterium]|nr:MAG: hypothetical protein JSW39_02090 [Desulfobacterales bacterium]
MNGKHTHMIILVLLAIAHLALIAPVQVWGSEPATGTLNIRVQATSDDAEESYGNVSTGIYDLELGDKLCGIRFQNVEVPPESTITNAYIQFTVDEVRSATTNLTIWGENDNDPSTFYTFFNNVSSRPKTNASVTWDNVSTWGVVGETGVAQQTPDLSTIVQEVVNRTDWATGNSMVFIFEGSGERVAEARQSGYDVAPILHIEYTSDAIEVRVSAWDDDAEESSDGTMNINSTDLDIGQSLVGVRFPGVNVPPGAQITKAYLEFTADEINTNGSQITIDVQAHDDAPAFFATANNISDRAKSGSYVAWNPVPEWDAVDNKYRTPDLSAKVQEIVGRSGWSQGSAMVFIIEGLTGDRKAVTYDADPSKGALLHIEYAESDMAFISLDKTELGASCYEYGNPVSDSFTITNTGAAALVYTLADDADWLALSSAGGTLAPGESVSITVSYSASTLAVGTHGANITIAGTDALNSPTELRVGLTIFDLPESAGCGQVPLYAENLVSPAILVLLDVSGSMKTLMDVAGSQGNPRTPDLSSIVQEIVDRSGWASGNPMVFIFEGTGRRTAKSYDANSAEAPLLHVKYFQAGSELELERRVAQNSDDAEEKIGDTSVRLTSGDLEMVDDNGTDQVVGVRFQDVSIPQGATITEAAIEFVVDESDSVSTSLTIWGEDLDNPPTFADQNDNISSRTKTSAAVSWNAIAAWEGATQERRIDIGKAVIGDLVQDRAIAWGFGSWTSQSTYGYVSSIDYTKVHVGCKLHNDAHQQDLQDAISPLEPLYTTPFAPSINAARKYFESTKADQGGDYYVAADCQPKFLINVTDGIGNVDSSVAGVTTATEALADAGVTPVAVGFGLPPDEAEQLYAMAQAANQKGEAFDTDEIYALHDEDAAGNGRPFFANNKQELIDTLNRITDRVKGVVFHGSAPAPTTSADLGDVVIVAKFDASRWTGDLDAIRKNSNGLWTEKIWSASEVMPDLAARSLWIIDPTDTNGRQVIRYAESTLANDAFSCLSTKPIGDIINSTPVIVGAPPFFYPFDNYMDYAIDKIHLHPRESMVYIGANDGMLHAFSLIDGTEKWTFVPKSMHAKLENNSDRCDPAYCHQYYIDGSPQVADIYADFGGGTKEWRTILVVGERKGGQAYFALDVTSGKPFDPLNEDAQNDDPATFLWEFTDPGYLGETWADPSIDRVKIKDVDPTTGGTAWAAFLGSGYLPLPEQQAVKEAYLYGILAHDGAELWKDASGTATNRIRIVVTYHLGYKDLANAFTVGEVASGQTSGALGTIVAVDTVNATLELRNVTGSFIDGENLVDDSGGQAKVDGTLTAGSLQNNALASPMPADFQGDYLADSIYVGDLYGNMYRLSNIGQDMTPQVMTLFTFENTTPNQNPVRGKASYGFGESLGDIWVYFGTGRFEAQADKYDTHQQYFFALKDNLTSPQTYKASDLVELEAGFTTVQINGQDKDVRIITGTNDSNLPWKMKLWTSGTSGSERVLTEPLVVGGVVFFTTFIPDENVCAGAGETWVFALDYQTGLAPAKPVFDIDKDGHFNDNDKVELIDGTKIVPIGILAGRGQGSHPVLHKDILFITTTGDGDTENLDNDDDGDDGDDDDDDDDDEDFFAQKVNLPEKRVRLESWKND